MTAYKVDRRSRTTNNNSDSYEFTNANKLFTDKGLQVRQCMLDLFGEELETLVIITIVLFTIETRTLAKVFTELFTVFNLQKVSSYVAYYVLRVLLVWVIIISFLSFWLVCENY